MKGNSSPTCKQEGDFLPEIVKSVLTFPINFLALTIDRNMADKGLSSNRYSWYSSKIVLAKSALNDIDFLLFLKIPFSYVSILVTIISVFSSPFTHVPPRRSDTLTPFTLQEFKVFFILS